MRYLLIVNLILNIFGSSAQFDGLWQGVRYTAGLPMEEGNLFYLEISSDGNNFKGYTKTEIYETDYFAVKNISGNILNNAISLKETILQKNKKSAQGRWCLSEGTLKYDSAKGYLIGTFTSHNCRNVFEEIILYKSNTEATNADDLELSHIWFKPFIKDFKAGLESPQVRKQMRDNFKFEPIYFDYDEALIRDNYADFLDRMIHVVKGHSDLRVLVTGHTDSDGSDEYNMELSKRRAQAIIDFFKAHGLSEDRLEFDFKGERSPADTNNTPEGRQHNRRVDFQFI